MTASGDRTINGHVSNHDAMPNGHVNGIKPNGTGANGHRLNGHYTNGNGINGYSVSHNQVSSNGHTNAPVNGHATTNGHSVSGQTSPSHSINTPIAVCGMACRLPGGLHTPQQLWEFLLAKGDARCRVPESRYNVSAFYDPSGKPGTVKTEYGYFLDMDLSKADGNFSSLVRRALERYDPHQLLMTEVAREAIEDAGEANWKGGLIGCYVGSFGEDWCEMLAKDSQQYGLYRVAGVGDYMLANHVSYEMDFRGPRFVYRVSWFQGID